DTLVVHVPPPAAAPQVPAVPARAPGQPLRADEQAAIVAFGERAPQLPPARRAELAGLLQPLTGATGAAGVERLYGIANGLLGRRRGRSSSLSAHRPNGWSRSTGFGSSAMPW